MLVFAVIAFSNIFARVKKDTLCKAHLRSDFTSLGNFAKICIYVLIQRFKYDTDQRENGEKLKLGAKPSPRRNLIYVGPKPEEVYVHSVLVVGQLGFETAQVQGLGRQCSKVLSIVRAVKEFGKARIVNIENFQTDEGVQGIRVFLEFDNNRGRAQNGKIGLGPTPNANAFTDWGEGV